MGNDVRITILFRIFDNNACYLTQKGFKVILMLLRLNVCNSVILPLKRKITYLFVLYNTNFELNCLFVYNLQVMGKVTPIFPPYFFILGECQAVNQTIRNRFACGS